MTWLIIAQITAGLGIEELLRLISVYGVAVVLLVALGLWLKMRLDTDRADALKREEESRKDSDEYRNFLLEELKNMRSDAKEDRQNSRNLETNMLIAMENSNAAVRDLKSVQEKLSSTLTVVSDNMSEIALTVTRLDTDVKKIKEVLKVD